MKLKKKTFYVRPDVIHSAILVLKKLKQAYIFAPTEADPQVVSLLLMKQVDMIFSDDSDILLLGGHKTIVDVGWHTSKCYIITQAHVIDALKRSCLSQ
jgi:hypothetical protein